MKEVVANPCNQYSGEETGRGHKSKPSLLRTRRGAGAEIWLVLSTCEALGSIPSTVESRDRGRCLQPQHWGSISKIRTSRPSLCSQSHPRLHNEFETSLGYERSYHRERKTENKQPQQKCGRRPGSVVKSDWNCNTRHINTFQHYYSLFAVLGSTCSAVSVLHLNCISSAPRHLSREIMHYFFWFLIVKGPEITLM